MSNRLYNLAQQVRSVRDANGRQRALHPSEVAVLLALANDARDADGGITTAQLTTAVIRRRTGLSEPAVRRAYRVLQASGHITRLPGATGEAARTRVHPVVRTASAPAQPPVTGVSSGYGRGVTMIGDPYHGDRGLNVESDNTSPNHDHATSARARRDREFEEGQPRLDPVEAVFAAWDAMAERVGLPGPVTRNAARRGAVAARLAEHGAGQVAMAIDRAERAARAGRFRRAGQGDLWLTFDAVFEVAGARAMNLLARLLDGEFGRETAPPPRVSSTVGSAPADAGLHPISARLRAQLGETVWSHWIAGLRFEPERTIAPSEFAADWVRTHYGAQLKAAGAGPVETRREKV